MASTAKILSAEYVLAVGISSYGAIRAGFVPWPAAVVKIGVGFGLLGLLATAAPELAVMLGAGFLLADLLIVATPSGSSNALDSSGKWNKQFGALPPPPAAGGDYYSLGFPGKKAA